MSAVKYIRRDYLERQSREINALTNLYSYLSTGVEKRDFGVDKIAPSLGMSTGQMSQFAATLEKLGILKRRLEYNAIIDGTPRAGRTYHWTLLMPQDEALNTLEQFHKTDLEDHAHPPAKSLKTRILDALNEHGSFESVEALAKVLRQPNENIDYHNVTHLLYSLSSSGYITFQNTGKYHKSNKSNDKKIPINIELRKIQSKPKKVENNVSIIHPVPAITEQSNNWNNMIDETNFPTIAKLHNRREWLEKASQFADNAGEIDLAIELMERTGKELSPIEAEALKLWEIVKKLRGS